MVGQVMVTRVCDYQVSTNLAAVLPILTAVLPVSLCLSLLVFYCPLVVLSLSISSLSWLLVLLGGRQDNGVTVSSSAGEGRVVNRLCKERTVTSA